MTDFQEADVGFGSRYIKIRNTPAGFGNFNGGDFLGLEGASTILSVTWGF